MIKKSRLAIGILAGFISLATATVEATESAAPAAQAAQAAIRDDISHETSFLQNLSQIFREKGEKEQKQQWAKAVENLRDQYKGTASALNASYLGALLIIGNSFNHEEKSQAQTFKEASQLLDAGVSKGRRSQDDLQHVLTLKNRLRSYSYLPAAMKHQRSQARSDLQEARKILESLQKRADVPPEFLKGLDRELVESKGRLDEKGS